MSPAIANLKHVPASVVQVFGENGVLRLNPLSAKADAALKRRTLHERNFI